LIKRFINVIILLVLLLMKNVLHISPFL